MTQEEIDETVAAVNKHGRRLIENRKEGIRVLVKLGIIEDPAKAKKKKNKRK